MPARVALGTKAESLERLRPLVRRSRVPPSVSFDHGTWRADPRGTLRRIESRIRSDTLIVRSSARREDTPESSGAGAFLSVADVPAADPQRVVAAVEAVIASYGATRLDDQILVQPMLRDVASSGVVLTRAPDTGAPYYVFSFDATSHRTDTVTSGTSEDVRTVYLLRGQPLRAELRAELGAVLVSVEEIEALVGDTRLDVEFVRARDGTVYLLQVRPIAAPGSPVPIEEAEMRGHLAGAARKLMAPNGEGSRVLGRRRAWSIMADWNPAEMIGIRPSPLALSLYRRLVTDETWAASRAALGFRDVRPCPLLVDVLGQPYVDVRTDFNSFLPASISDELGARLVDHFVARLEARPELHDKVEFEILPTCIDFDFERWRADLASGGFSAAEIETLRKGLAETTRATITRVEPDLATLRALGRRCANAARLRSEPLTRARLLLADAQRVGFVAFANLARAAFVAKALARSLARRDGFATAEIDALLASVETIGGRMRRDGAAVYQNRLGWRDFVREYGHLRPGTYDIRSPCYASRAEIFLRPFVRPPLAPTPRLERRKRGIAPRRDDLGLGLAPDALVPFIRTAIEAREMGKFLVTRNVSAALEALAQWGAEHGATREDLAFLSLEDLERDDIKTRWPYLARSRSAAARRIRVTHLPAQISSSEDLRCFESRRAEPSYVTGKRVVARVATVDCDDARGVVDGRIVAISHADPGYDWLFSRSLAGLVTMYGGPNSHMAIRAAEFRLPAAIGVGATRFEKLQAATLLDLDCRSRRVEVLR